MNRLQLIGVSYCICMVLTLVPLLAVIASIIPFSLLHLIIFLSWGPLGCGIYCAFKDTSIKTKWGLMRVNGCGVFSSLLILLTVFILPVKRGFWPHYLPIPFSFDVISVTCWVGAAVLAFIAALVSFLLEEPTKADAAS